MCSDTLETQGLDSCGQGAEEDAVGFTKTFPDIPCVSQMSGGLSLRLSIHPGRLSIPLQDLNEVEKRRLTGNVELSNCPLRTDSESLKSPIIHTINFIL